MNLGIPKTLDTIIGHAENTEGVRWNLPWNKAVWGTKPEGIGIMLKNYGLTVSSTKTR